MDPKVIDTIEVLQPSEATAPEPKLTAEQLAEGGFAPAEVEAAKKHGLIADDKEPPKPADGTAPPEDKKTGDEPETPPTPEPYKKGDRRAELAFLEKNPEKEDEVINDYSPSEKAMYFLRKSEKHKRQRIEIERDQVVIQKRALEQRVTELEAQAKTTGNTDTPKGDDLDSLGDEGLDDEKPLTASDLDRIEKEKAEKSRKAREDNEAQARRAAQALTEQEAEARARYTDFEEATKHTEEILKAIKTNTFDELVPDARQRDKIARKVQEFVTAAANADRFTESQYNAVDIGYELGKLHPGFGKKQPDPANGKNGKQENGEPLSPETVDRMVHNANRRGSSAALNGGGSRRVISVKDITLEQAAALSLSDFRKLPKDVRERLARQ